MSDVHTSTKASEQEHIDISRADRQRSLDALHALELHAGSAAPGREQDWLTGVRDAITTLEQALALQEGNATPDEGLLSAVERDQPRLRRRVEELRQRSLTIRNDLTALSRRLHAIDGTDTIDSADIRQQLERIASEMRYQRARETDLVYEAYAVDLGEGD